MAAERKSSLQWPLYFMKMDGWLDCQMVEKVENFGRVIGWLRFIA